MKKILVFIFSLIFTQFIYAQIIDKKNIKQKWKTDTNKHNVPLNQFMALLPRDGIPPIDRPKFLTKSEGQSTYLSTEPVISIELDGKAKAYPLNILTYHEIVNDKVGNIPITATYCPLCNAAIIFDRRLKHNNKKYLLDFGVSGMLRKSDLVMWDRQTETWWQQFTGEGLVGDLAGVKLNMLPAQIISVEEFFKNHPKGLILSTDTGFEKEKAKYGKNVYEGYDDKSHEKPRLFFEEVDKRLPAMERVIDISFDEKEKIYPLSIIMKKGVLHDELDSKSIVIFHQFGTKSILDTKELNNAKDIGSVTVFNPIINKQKLSFRKYKKTFIDKETESVWTITGKCIEGKLVGMQLDSVRYANHFAFAWFAFHPDTLIYKE